MNLFRFTSTQAIQLHGEDTLSTSHFQVGAQCGVAKILAIEAMSLGVIVRREGAVRDLFISSPGVGEILEKSKPEPSQLQDARKGK